MKNKIATRTLSLLLALVCVLGILPLSAFADTGLSSAPASITQKSSDYMYIGGRPVRYRAASDTINNNGLPYVFDEQVSVPGLDAPVRALCAYHKGTLGSGANGQKWDLKTEVNNESLRVLLTYVYAHTYGDFTDVGNAVGLEHWGEYWSDIWFMVAQAMSWYYEYGIITDVSSNREGFISQAAEEFVAAMKLYHQTYGQSSWIKDWSAIDIHSIIDSNDGGKTGNSAYDYIATGVNLVLDHPEYYHKYHLWMYEWDKTQTWMLPGQSSTPMQHLLIAVPDSEDDSDTLQMTVKKLEAGTNKPLPGVTFKIESADGSGDFSVTRQTGADGTITLTSEADDLSAGQYKITEEAVPEGYVAQTVSQTVTVMPNGSVANTFTFYNEPNKKDGDGSIRKVDSDNPAVGIPGAVIRITSVKLDDGGSFFGEYITGDGGYISKEDLDFTNLPLGSYLAEEITPPQGFILSSDVSKVKQPFVWDGEHDVSLVFENSAKVKVQLVKVDESNNPVSGCVFVILRDGQVIGTEETKADGTITVSNVVEGYYEFREVFAPSPFDVDRSPVGVHVNAEDLQGEQTITVTKVNHHKRSLTIQKRDAETGDPVPNTSFHIRGVNIGYENDVTTGADGKITLPNMPSGCFEIEETSVPAPWILDTNNRKTVWIDAEQGKDVVVDFVNSTRPGLRLLKLDGQTGKPISGITFLIEEVDGGFSTRRQTDQNGLIVLGSEEGLRPGAFKITEVDAGPNHVLDDTVHIVQLEENRTTTIELTNLVKPTLKILKVDSITKNPVANAKFQIWRASGDTKTGEYNDLGTFYSNEAGEIVLEHTDPGWFKISELEAPSGYSIKQADYEFYLAAGETKTVQVENVPLSALVVYKYDRVTGEPVEGAVFQIKYLSGTSGTGGTVIGTYRTQKNGSFTVTGLQAGAYVVEELASDSGHIVDAAPQTAYISGKQQDVVQLYFGNSPKSSLLISKVDANNGAPLSDVEFLITTSDGTLLGSANGKYVTDSSGTILIENLDPNLTLVVKETRAKAGYILDDVPQTIKTKPGETVKLEFRNKKQGNLIIHKLSSADKSPIEGAQFKLTYADGKVVDAASGQLSSNGLYWTSKEGQIIVSGITGTIVATEVASAPGYAIDPNTRTQTIVINPGDDTQNLYFYNDPLCSLTISKVDSVTGKPIPNTTFTVKYAGGEMIGRYTTGTDGTVTVSGLLPGSTVVVTEYKVPSTHVLNTTPQTITLKSGSNTVTSGAVGSTGGTGTGGGNNLDFENDPKMTLTVKKYIKGTNYEPLAGVCFKITEGSGTPVGPGDGLYYTSSTGEIVVEGLEPGATVTVREVSTVEGYVLDGEPKTIKIKAGEQAPELIFWNEKAGSLVIQKKNSLDGSPLAGVQFQLTYADGSYVDYDNGHMSSKGLYETDASGEIRITGITGTVIAKELKTLPGFTIDPATQTQTVTIRPDDCQTLVFYNTPVGNFELIKVVEGHESKRIPNVTFEIRRASDGGLVDTITTGSDGRATLQLDAGNYYAVETKCPSEYKLDSTPHYFTMQDGGKGTTLTVTNKAVSGITLHKTDAVTKKGIYGVTFLLYDANHNLLTQETTDNQGYAYFEGLTEGGRYYLRELENEGYIPDTQLKTVTVKSGGTTLVEWENTPITAQIQITKKSADYNPTNGLPAGTLLEGAVFEIRDKAGNLVDTIRSDSRGVATSKPLPLSRYTIREVKAPANYGISDQELTAYLEHAGQIVRFEVTNKSLTTGVSITKTGPKEAMAGQPVNYTFSSIANNSNVMLTSFYWRDTLPAEVRLNTVVTGTYNFPGVYKITYRVNGGEYRTLADNLSTSKNYTLAASPAALGLASNERVTEIMFVFGQAPAGFAQVEKPQLKCTAVSAITSTAFTNIADWQRRQNNNNNFSAVVPYDLEQQRKETREMLDDLTTRDQRMMFAVVTLVHLADSKEELDSDTDALQSTARKHLCQLATLNWQQADGLVTALPLGLRRIDALRTLTTEALAVLMPFKAQEIRDQGGVYYGQNTISKNLIIANRKELLNGNGFVLGVSGSGKSFTAKEEIVNVALATGDDIIIIDPEKEYGPIIEGLGGEVVNISATSRNHINAMDMEQGYGDGENPVVLKSEFLLSLCEQLVGSGQLSAKEKSIIDRCTAQCYHEYIRGGCRGEAPTLQDFHAELLRQPEPEARDVALAIELFTEGSLNTFAKPTNVDTDARILCYDIRDLGKQLLPVGMLVVLDSVFNRVIRNRQLGRNTWIYIDEIYLLFQHEYSANFLFTLWKRVRKYGALCTGLTQNVEDLLQSHTARTMLANSEFLVMLNQASTDRMELAQLLNISDNQLSYITNVDSGRGLIKCGSAIVPFVNSFPKNTHLYRLMTTKPSELGNE